MDSRAKILGHSIHQTTIVFPLGLLATAVIFDVAHLVTKDGTMAVVAFWMIVAGVLGGLGTAPFGWADWLAIPARTRAKAVGLVHGLGNIAVLLLFIGSAWLRWEGRDTPGAPALALSFAGAGLSLVTGWLGGELVSRLGVGVYDGAHLDSPNSLSGRPATDSVKRPAG